LPQILNFANSVKFRQKSIFLSQRPVYVISSVFRQKRNHLEPSDNLLSVLDSRFLSTILYRLVIAAVSSFVFTRWQHYSWCRFV